jgi:hypothetical protein
MCEGSVGSERAPKSKPAPESLTSITARLPGVTVTSTRTRASGLRAWPWTAAFERASATATARSWIWSALRRAPRTASITRSTVGAMAERRLCIRKWTMRGLAEARRGSVRRFPASNRLSFRAGRITAGILSGSQEPVTHMHLYLSVARA